jgi:hypothetical protein
MPRSIYALFAFGLACSEGPTGDGSVAEDSTAAHETSHGHMHTSGEATSEASTDESSEGVTTEAAEESTGAPAVDTWESWALPHFFEVYCNDCHPGASPRDFSDYDVVLANEEHIRCGVAPEALPECDHHIEPGHLPIGDGPHPGEEERWRLVAWMQAGAPRD